MSAAFPVLSKCKSAFYYHFTGVIGISAQFCSKDVKFFSMHERHSDREFINFLQNELALSIGDLTVALRKYELENAPLPMLLWQYGLVSIEQLEQIFDWLEDQ